MELVDTGAGLQAILPKPAPETTEIVYYIEGTDLEFNPSLTPEYTPYVTDLETCKRRDPPRLISRRASPLLSSVQPSRAPQAFRPDSCQRDHDLY